MMPYVLMIAGLCWWIYALFLRAKGDSVSNWDVVNGRVLTSTARDIEIDGVAGIYSIVEYGYSYCGIQYTGINRTINSDMDYPKSSKNDRIVDGLLKQFPKGSLVKVYVNPKKPEEACLILEGNALPYLVFLGGVFFFIAGYVQL